MSHQIAIEPVTPCRNRIGNRLSTTAPFDKRMRIGVKGSDPLENNLGVGARMAGQKVGQSAPIPGSSGFIHKALVKDLHWESPLDASEGAFFCYGLLSDNFGSHCPRRHAGQK